MTKNNAVSGQFNANLYKVTGLSPLKVGDYMTFPHGTPGNVGICLSGGGSRAMTAGMGQLLGLLTVQKNNFSLLSQSRAVSTVSGGSWLGVTFEYLNDGDVPDHDYLGTYIKPGDLTTDGLEKLSEKTIGFRCTKKFSLLDLLLQAVWLGIVDKVPTHMLWQTLMGIHILQFYGLFTSDSSHTPDSFFTLDKKTRDAIIENGNSPLKDETVHLIASGDGRAHRPWQVCNMGMFVKMDGEKSGFQFLVPVQATPLFTGIVSTPPNAKDFSGRLVGGGGVSSFAFNSDLESVDAGGTGVVVKQDRQWALVDIVGTSSAAFSETMQNLAKDFVKDPQKLFQAAKDQSVSPFESMNVLKPYMKTKKPGLFHRILEEIENSKIARSVDAEIDKLESFFKKEGLDMYGELSSQLEDIIRALDPLYKYWPVLDASPEPNVTATNFADGGSLENTGINALLTYSDIHKLISFVNTSTALSEVEFGIYDVDGTPVPDTNVKIDGQVTSLFGYQPYNDSREEGKSGYRTYRDKDGNFRGDVLSPEFRNNQVFPHEKFIELLQGIWAATGPGAHQGAANFTQQLETMENTWFGVAPNRPVTVLWVYNNFIGDWYDQLDQGVKDVVDGIKDFPNYSTFNTELSNTQVNLLSNMTAWNIIEGNKAQFLAMYGDD